MQQLVRAERIELITFGLEDRHAHQYAKPAIKNWRRAEDTILMPVGTICLANSARSLPD
jgi:hypothetical protein